MKKKIIYLLIFFIIAIGMLLRGQEAFFGNFLFLIDQGRDMMAVKKIVFDYDPTLIGPYTSLQGVFQGPLWYYLLAIPTLLFGGNPWGGVVLMFAISIAILFIVTVWMNRLFGITAAVFSLFLFTISPEAIAAATYAWNPHPMWLLMVLYIFCFYNLISGKKRYHLFVWPILAAMFHFETALAAFMVIATFLYLIITARLFFKTKMFVFGLFISLVFFLPQVLFETRNDFLMTRSFFRLFQGSNQGLFIKGEKQQYLHLVQAHINDFYYNFGTTFLRDGNLKIMPSIGLVFLVIFLSLFYPFPIRYWFLTGFQSFYILLVGLIVGKLWKLPLARFPIILTCGIFIFYVFVRIYNLYFTPPDYGGVAKLWGKRDAINIIYQDAKKKPFNLLVFTPPVNTDSYDYLIWWYGKRKYNYLPGKEKKGLVYLLIEPDPEKSWSYKGWLETVIKTGKIIKTRELSSGFIIQKRTYEKNSK